MNRYTETIVDEPFPHIRLERIFECNGEDCVVSRVIERSTYDATDRKFDLHKMEKQLLSDMVVKHVRKYGNNQSDARFIDAEFRMYNGLPIYFD